MWVSRKRMWEIEDRLARLEAGQKVEATYFDGREDWSPACTAGAPYYSREVSLARAVSAILNRMAAKAVPRQTEKAASVVIP